MPKKKDDIRKPISLRQWKRMRHGRGYESFHRAMKAYGEQWNTLADVYRHAWEVYLCKLVREYMDVDEDSCGAPWHVPRAFGMMEWDFTLAGQFMSYVEGGDYAMVYAMNSDDTPPYLTEACDDFVAEESDSIELILDAIERARRLDYESEKERRNARK